MSEAPLGELQEPTRHTPMTAPRLPHRNGVAARIHRTGQDGLAASVLQLSPNMRYRLRAAVRRLLEESTVSDCPDTTRLATIVLMAKASHTDGMTNIRTRELGRSNRTAGC